MKRLSLVAAMILGLTCGTAAAKTPVSEDSESCLECHASISPGIVKGWERSRHAQTTPGKALAARSVERRMSSDRVADQFKNVSVGCAECHTLRPKAHKDTFEHNGYEIHVVVSPKDCATCHPKEEAQYGKNLMSRAHGNLVHNDVYQLLMKTINDTAVFADGKVTQRPANEETSAESCLYCHGTELAVSGTVTKETEFGEMAFPVLRGWPNQGTGRINLDGSRGACSACHTRHEFSIQMARKPYTCKECHVGPDVPAFKVYEASKHGNIFSSLSGEWDFRSVPWTVGQDFRAPTCAACHMSLLVNTEGDVIVERSHEIKDRLPYRIFGLIYAHPHPKHADTTVIRNTLGLQLPTDFEGGIAARYLIDENDQKKLKQNMQAACLGCHGKAWVDGHWTRFENTIKETNAATLAATMMMEEIWRRGWAKGLDKGSNPFDEYIEKRWSNNWLFYANTVRFVSAMAGGGDFGVFADGRYHLSQNIREIHDWLELRGRIKE